MFHFSAANIELELRNMMITPDSQSSPEDGTVMFSVIDLWGQLSDYGPPLDLHNGPLIITTQRETI